MSTIVKDYERIQRIATNKILVAEDSGVYSIFHQRRVLCANFRNLKEENHEHFINLLNEYDDLIKRYFNL